MKYLLLNFKGIPTYGWVEYSDKNGLELSEQISFDNYQQISHLAKNEICIVIDNHAADEPTLSISLENILKAKYSITTQKVTNALKKIDASGKVVKHLDRESYQRLSTPLKATTDSISEYFAENSSWDFEKYLKLNNHSYEDYQTIDAVLILDSK